MADLVAFDRQAFTQALARTNRKITNPVLLSFAGRPHSPFTIVRHIGRRTGRPYATPVIATWTAEGFVIPLTYGDKTDWLRNLQTAGEAIIAYQGHAYHVARPLVMAAQDWAQVVGPLTACMLARAEVEGYVRIERLSAAPMDQAVYDQIVSDHPMARGLLVLGGGAAIVAAFVLLARRRGR
jgi:deazaflavin-dependent oxidoreductase (nitroreductase family)